MKSYEEEIKEQDQIDSLIEENDNIKESKDPYPKLEIGKSYGLFLILDIISKSILVKSKYRKIKLARVKCECGVTKEIRLEHIKNKVVKSCGCLNYSVRSKDPISRAVHYVMTYTLSSSKKRKIEHKLSLEDIRSIIFKECFYCGEFSDNQKYKTGKYDKGIARHNGLDRIDSSLGYTVENVVSCCAHCNTMKLDYTTEEFKNKIAKVFSKICKIQDEKQPIKLLPKIWKYYDGLVILKDYMGNDLSVVNAARVSFNKQNNVFSENDKKLIYYLAKHKHMSPFRHVQFSLILQDIPEVVIRQLYKHQVGISYTAGDFRESATVWNEVSGRYVEFDFDFFEPVSFRPQHESNKQASYAHRTVAREDEVRSIYRKCIKNSWDKYNKLLSLGVCKEQARLVIPMSFKTSIVWTASLEALIHFVNLRKHESAQVEIQTLANIIEKIVMEICPISSSCLLYGESGL